MLSSPNSTCEWTCINDSVYFYEDTVAITSGLFRGGYGAYQFVLTETNGSCVSIDTVVYIYQPIYLDAGNDTTICSSHYQMSADTVYSGYWTFNDNRILISDDNDPNAIISYDTNTVVWPQNGAFSTLFFWTAIPEDCSYTDSVRITFSQCSNNVNIFNKSKITRIYPNPAHNNIQIDIEGSQYADKID